MNTRFYDKLDFNEYLNLRGVSTSDIKFLLDNPYKYKLMKSGQFFTEQTAAMKFGSAAHCFLLEREDFFDRYAVAPNVNKRTIDGKKKLEKFEAENAGKILISESDFEIISKMEDELLKSGLGEYVGGSFEISFHGTLPKFGGAMLKGRADILDLENDRIVDLKCVSDASPKSFIRQVSNFKYYIQAYLYKKLCRVKNFYFLALETKPPYSVGLYELDYLADEHASEEIKKALEILENIDDVKNSYVGNKAMTLTLPNYVYYDLN